MSSISITTKETWISNDMGPTTQFFIGQTLPIAYCTTEQVNEAAKAYDEALQKVLELHTEYADRNPGILLTNLVLAFNGKIGQSYIPENLDTCIIYLTHKIPEIRGDGIEYYTELMDLKNEVKQCLI